MFTALVLMTATSQAATETVIVGQTNGGGANGVNQFNAAAITITAGDTVQWDSAPDNRSHNVTSYAETTPGTPDWQSDILRSSAANTYSHAFNSVGTFTYYCSLHAGRGDAAPAVIDANIASGNLMVGKITVVGLNTPTQTPSPSPTSAATPSQTPGPTQSPTPGPTVTTTPGPSGTPTPLPSATAPKQGDNDCDGDVDSVDALKGLRHVAGLSVQQGPGCTPIGEGEKGDVDCDGDVDSVDALKILRHVAGLPVQQGPGCTPIGS